MGVSRFPHIGTQMKIPESLRMRWEYQEPLSLGPGEVPIPTPRGGFCSPKTGARGEFLAPTPQCPGVWRFPHILAGILRPLLWGAPHPTLAPWREFTGLQTLVGTSRGEF